MASKKYVNPFQDVHEKAQAAIDHARRVREEEAERRKKNAEEEAARENVVPRRKLRIVRRDFPPLGICEWCNAQFKSTLQQLDKAEFEIRTLFDAHQCKREDAS